MAPRKQEEVPGVEGEGSFVAGYERVVQTGTSLPRRAEAAAPAAAQAAAQPVEASPAARRREQILQARAQQEARKSAEAGAEEEDFNQLSVRELKERIRATGSTIPPTVVDKAELVTLLKLFTKANKAAASSASAAAPSEEPQPRPAATRARSSRRGFAQWAGDAAAPAAAAAPAPSAAEEAPFSRRESSPVAESTGARIGGRGFAQWAGGDASEASTSYTASAASTAPTRPSTATAAPPADEGAAEEDLSTLPLKELRKRLKDLNVEIPASICEKREIVELLRQSLARQPQARGAAVAEQTPAEEAPPRASGRSSFSARAAEVERRREEQRREEEEQREQERREQERRERRERKEQERRQQEEEAARREEEREKEARKEQERAKARELDERRAEERRRNLEKRRAEDQSRADERRKEEEQRRIEVEQAAAEAAAEAARPQENLAALSIKELKKRILEAGGSIPANIVDKSELVEALRRLPKQKARTSSGQDNGGSRGSGGAARGGGGGNAGPLPKATGVPDRTEDLEWLSEKQLKIKNGAAGVTVGKHADKDELIRLLQDAQSKRRCLQKPGEFEDAQAEDEDDGEDLSKMSVRDLKKYLTDLGAKIPATVRERSELVNLLKQAKKRKPKSVPASKHRGANGSYDRRRSDDAKPWMPPKLDRKKKEQVPPAGPPTDKESLWLTFGYVAGDQADAPYARFDIREETCLHFGGFKHGQVIKEHNGMEKHIVVGVRNGNGRPTLWTHAKSKKKPTSIYWALTPAKMKANFTAVGEEELLEALPDDYEVFQDSDEECHRLCPKCRLPVGELGYVTQEGSGVQYADDIIRNLLVESQGSDKERLWADWERTWTNRRDYDIGWVPERMIPINEHVAARLGNMQFGGPMISLLMDGDPPTLSLTSSIEPNTSVNLNYLITALKVRLNDGREPVFSLDPCPPFDDMRNGFQKKRFDPEWMRGTPAGEVLFQADYHLKELSMGEYDQPVTGMKNAMDFSEDQDYWDWRAREWFVVVTAEVWRSADGVVMPHLVMGVEAREQIVSQNGELVDAAVTNGGHPLVIYGEVFTHYFDVIAERLSVIYHLRELTKAQIIARFIVDSGVVLDESWLRVLDRATFTELKIPQHLREIGRTQLCLRNGDLAQSDTDMNLNIWGVYGGVDLNLDKFDLSEAQQSDKEVLPGEPIDLEKLTPEELRQMIIDHGGTIPPGISEKPDLIDIMMQIMEGFADFWGCISGSGPSPYSREEQEMLRRLFNPFLSDRRLDDHRFIPPTRDADYIQKLRKLMDEEWFIQEKRKQDFLSPGFTPGQHSEPFPYVWRTKFGVAIDGHPCRAPGELAGGRPLKKVSPSKAKSFDLARMDIVFDGLAEDGVRYRIYQDGQFEVRTIQPHDQSESIGAVFAFEVPQGTSEMLRGQERLAYVSLCVGWGNEGPSAGLLGDDLQDAEATPHYRFFLMVETAGRVAHTVITEMLPDGTVTWEEDPPDLEHRRSRARIYKGKQCNSSVSQLKAHRQKWDGRCKPYASHSSCKQYAQGAYDCATGVVVG